MTRQPDDSPSMRLSSTGESASPPRTRNLRGSARAPRLGVARGLGFEERAVAVEADDLACDIGEEAAELLLGEQDGALHLRELMAQPLGRVLLAEGHVCAARLQDAQHPDQRLDG